LANAPLNAPTGVRAAPTMTMSSFMGISLSAQVAALVARPGEAQGMRCKCPLGPDAVNVGEQSPNRQRTLRWATPSPLGQQIAQNSGLLWQKRIF
jgi:hypothetical protein